MKNNWLKSNKSIDVSVCDMTECNAVIDLKAENEKLKAELDYEREIKETLNKEWWKLKSNEWDNYYYTTCVKTNFEGARGATEQLLKCENLKDAMYYAKIADMYLHFNEDVIKREIKEKQNKYRKALEEIKEMVNHLKEDTGKYNIYDLSNKINEVLDEN